MKKNKKVFGKVIKKRRGYNLRHLRGGRHGVMKKYNRYSKHKERHDV